MFKVDWHNINLLAKAYGIPVGPLEDIMLYIDERDRNPILLVNPFWNADPAHSKSLPKPMFRYYSDLDLERQRDINKSVEGPDKGRFVSVYPPFTR